MKDYAEQMKTIFGITDYPEYPETETENQNAVQFAEQFHEVTLLRNDPVFYTTNTSDYQQPNYLKTSL